MEKSEEDEIVEKSKTYFVNCQKILYNVLPTINNDKLVEYIIYYYEISKKYVNVELNELKLSALNEHPKKLKILEELCKKCIIFDVTHEIVHGRREDLLFGKMIKKMRE
jgi:hypothetical protein